MSTKVSSAFAPVTDVIELGVGGESALASGTGKTTLFDRKVARAGRHS